jgi:hypothetical protein
MAKKPMTIDGKLTRLTHLVEKGFGAVAHDIADIRANMASKDDVRAIINKQVPPIVRHEIAELVPSIVAHELKPLRQQLQQDIEGINDRLDTLEALYANLRGVTKEIDDLRGQVRTIQKHLGLNTEIAA